MSFEVPVVVFFNFDDAQSIFLLLLMILVSHLRSHCLIQGHKDLLICFLLSYKVSSLTFISLIHFIHPTRSHTFINNKNSTNFKPTCSYSFETPKKAHFYGYIVNSIIAFSILFMAFVKVQTVIALDIFAWHGQLLVCP